MYSVKQDGDNSIFSYYQNHSMSDIIVTSLGIIVIGMVIITILYLLYNLIDSLKFEWYNTSGKVVDKIYSPSRTTTGVGIISTSNGGVSPVVTTNTTSDKWILMVEIEYLGIQKVYVDADYYYKVNKGEVIDVACKIYWLSKTRSDFYYFN